MINAVEKGRQLHVTIGDDEDARVFVVPPVNVEAGAQLLIRFLGIYTKAAKNPIGDGIDLAKTAIGDANYQAAQDLRPGEFDDLVNAALYWNVYGGGSEALNAYLTGGRPKATAIVFERAGVSLRPSPTVESPSQTSPTSESAPPTP